MTTSERGVWQIIYRTIKTGGSYEDAKRAGEEAGRLLTVPEKRVRELLKDAWSQYGS